MKNDALVHIYMMIQRDMCIEADSKMTLSIASKAGLTVELLTLDSSQPY